jgi:hypothetical protein
MSLSSIILIVHVIGFALCIGAATVKVLLLSRCGSDPGFARTFLNVSRPITKSIIAGMILVTISGVTWLLTGYDFSTPLIVKLILFGAVWVLGPYIDNAIEPKFKAAVSAAGAFATAEFKSAWKRYMMLDSIAMLLFYAIVLVWLIG